MSLHQLEKRNVESSRRFRRDAIQNIEKVIAKHSALATKMEKRRLQLSAKITRKTKKADAESDPTTKLLVDVSLELDQWSEEYKRLLTLFQQFQEEKEDIAEQLLALCYKQYKKLCQSNTYNSIFVYKRDPIVAQTQRDQIILS